MSRTALALRLGLALVALGLLWLFARELPVLHWVAAGARRVHDAGPRGALFAGGAIYLLALLFAPIPALVVACGWLYGPWGALFALPAVTLSAVTGFSLSRALGRSAAARSLLTHPRLRALAELAERGGILTVAIIRVSPLLPFTPSNAVMGLTGISLRDLLLGTLLGLLPAFALYAWVGSLLPSAEAIERGQGLHLSLLWPGAAAAGLAIGLLGFLATRRLRARA